MIHFGSEVVSAILAPSDDTPKSVPLRITVTNRDDCDGASALEVTHGVVPEAASARHCREVARPLVTARCASLMTEPFVTRSVDMASWWDSHRMRELRRLIQCRADETIMSMLGKPRGHAVVVMTIVVEKSGAGIQAGAGAKG